MNIKAVLLLLFTSSLPATVHSQDKEVVVPQPSPVPGIYIGGNAVDCPKPVYPLEARRYEVEGTTVAEVLVGDDGKPHGQRVYKSSGWDILDDATLSLMAACRFSPVTRNGQPAGAHWSKVAFKWTLDQKGDHAIRPVLIRESCPDAQGLILVDDPADGRGVLLRFLVSPSGEPFGVKSVNNGSSALLQQEAIRKLNSCKFQPSVHNGLRVPGNAFARYQADPVS